MKAALRAALAVVVVYASVGARAQSGGVANPADPSALAPAPKHESVFERYRRFEEPKVAPWRTANEEVGALRGHIDHVKETGAASDEAPPVQKDGRGPAQAPLHRHSK
jgi:hypothetical protein